MTVSSPGLWVTFLTPFGLEVAADSGAGWLGVDLQHGDLDQQHLAPLLRVAAVAGLPLLARTASHDPAALCRVLDSGVDGVIVPAVESAEQAEALVAAAHLPPRGRRSGGAARATLPLVAGRRAGGAPLLLPMVETVAGLAAAKEIAGVDGVDGLFVGPYDLALSLGHPVTSDEVVSAIADAVEAARAHGKLAGAFTGDASLAARLPRLDLHAVDTDVAALRAGLAVLLGRS